MEQRLAISTVISEFLTNRLHGEKEIVILCSHKQLEHLPKKVARLSALDGYGTTYHCICKSLTGNTTWSYENTQHYYFLPRQD